MITPKQEKAFLVLLDERKRLSLEEVIQFFTKSSPKTNFEEVSEALNFLWIENLFSVREEGNEEEIWFSSEMETNPERYFIEFNNYLDKDAILSESHQGTMFEDKVEVIDAYYRWVSVEGPGVVKVIGELEGASSLMERIRAFTNYFAFNLTTKNIPKIISLLSAHIKQNHTEDELWHSIKTVEGSYGNIEYYDHIEVVSVYNGDHSDDKVSGEMKLPKGVSRKSRLGEAAFQLVTAHTPNGVSIFTYTVYLAIVLENSELKVCDLQFRAT